MVYTVYMQRLDQYSHNLLFEVLDPSKNCVATIKKDADNTTRLYYENNTYEFPFSIKSLTRAEFAFPYPVSSSKNKRLGYHIKKSGETFTEYYGETAVVEKRRIFSKKIGFEVFKFHDRVCYMVKVGLPQEANHYYCLIDALAGQTVGVIERLSANAEEARAKIYLASLEDMECMLLLLSTEMVMTVTSNEEGQLIDPSAGKYISLREEEKAFLDKNFIQQA